MLRTLSIRDIVLIERLDLDFGPGLNVLTGETGAGKSILLDALGFALGQKVRRDLVRAGAERGTVIAEFDVPPGPEFRAIFEELDIDPPEGELILRRTATAGGPSRGFVNDQRVSSAALQDIGARLVEVHGQHDDRGLLSPRAHRPLLDAYAGLGNEAAAVRAAWTNWQNAERALSAAQEALAKSAADAEFLRHSVEEMDKLAPEIGEDDALDAERRLIRQAVGLTEEISKAAAALSGEGAEGLIAGAVSRLTHVAEKAEGRLEMAIGAVDRTMTELAEAQAALGDVLEELSFDPGRLDVVEERLFALRRLARKHDVQPDALPALAADMTRRLADVDQGEERIGALESEVATSRRHYDQSADVLSAGRKAASGTLDTAVTAELVPLRMDTARFITEITPADPGVDGTDTVRFTATINPGAPAGPIDRIASGGELSRFLLALKVQLATRNDGMVLVFDEIDRGVGGATADAVGRRLSRLAASGQVLVVTHSPQVAAMGDRHFQIAKSAESGVARTGVEVLDAEQREEEIARMLAGDKVTDAALSAARELIRQARPTAGAA